MEWIIKAARIKKRGFDDPTFLKNKYTTQVFADVPTSSQFYQPIMSAYSNNIAHGYSNGTGKFGVGDNVTRGSLAKIIDNVRKK